MSTYKLNINFSEEALKTIYASKQRLALVKSVEGDRGKPVIWVATSPFEINEVEWKSEYAIYASRQEAKNGASITKLSETMAIDRLIYDFKDAVFQNENSTDGVGMNQYGVHNVMNEYDSLTFGLAASAVVNGKSEVCKPINANTLPFNHTAVMSPIERVSVFLAADIDDGVVQTHVYSTLIRLEYRGSDVEKTIRYDASKGIFVPE